MQQSKSKKTPLNKIWEAESAEMTKCPQSVRLVQTDVKVKERERSQPIKIAQLLGLTGNSKSAQKSCGSVHKRALPERLTSTVINAKTTISSAKRNRFTSAPFTTPGKGVRRNLNFNEIQRTSSRKSVTQSKLKNSASNESSNNGDPRQNRSRASLLPQPTAIRDAHSRKQNKVLRRVSKISEVSERRSSVNMDDVCQTSHAAVSTNANAQATNQLQYRKIESPNVSDSKSVIIQAKNLSTIADKSNTKHFYTELSTPEIFQTSESTIVTSTNVRSTMCPTRLNFMRNELTLNNNDRPDAGNNVTLATAAITCNGIKNIETKTTGNVDGCLENICTGLKDTRLSSQVDVANSRHTSPDMICIDKQTILHLQNNLNLYISSMENNAANLKSSLTLLATAISNNVSHERNTECQPDFMRNMELNESEIKLTTVIEEPIKVMLDKECQVEMCCKNAQVAIDISKESTLCTPRMPSIKVADLNEENQNHGNNKENDQYSNSKKPTDSLEDSFLNLEKDLDIVHVKQLSQNQHLRKSMPNLAENKNSLREYMALKSSVNFLETPNTNRFKTHLSTKILKDLRNLYSDSPDT